MIESGPSALRAAGAASERAGWRWARAVIGASALAASSCLVTSTQDFPEPVRSRPRLSGANASPPIDAFVLVSSEKQTVTFRSRVSSEDNNEDVIALLFVGDSNDVSAVFDRARVPAGKLNQEGRFVELTYGLSQRSLFSGQRAPSGCYPVTMVVSHRFDLAGHPEDPDDVDRLVWWVLAGSPDQIDQIKALGGCPTQP